MRNLLLFQLHEYPVAAYASAVTEIQEAPPLYQLPFGPDYLAGLIRVGNRAVALADLGVRCGLPQEAKTCSTALWIDKGEDFGGFVVNDVPRQVKVEQPQIQPLPAYLETPWYTQRVLIDGKILPLLDLKKLFRNLEKNDVDSEPGNCFGNFPRVAARSLVAFRCANHLLAAPARRFSILEDTEEITPLFGQPDFLLGIVQRDGKPVPVISPARRLELVGTKQTIVLICDTQKGPYGLEVDADIHPQVIGPFSPRAIPARLARPGLDRAIEVDNRIVPLLNPFELVTRTGKIRPKRGSVVGTDRLCPEVVVEFELAGSRFAFDKAVVKGESNLDKLTFFPGNTALVVGMQRDGDAICPVLDFTPYFRARQGIPPEAKLLRVKTSGFRALVLVDGVLGERRIRADERRIIPVADPDGLISGCIVADNHVILVLDPHAMADNFDETVANSFRQQLENARPETELELEPEPEAKPEAQLEAGPEAGPETELDVAPELGPMPEAASEMEVEAEPEPETVPEVEVEAERDEEPEPEPMLEAAPEAEVEAEPEPETVPEVEVEAERDEEPEPEPMLEAAPEAEGETEPEPEAVPEVEVEAERDEEPEPEPLLEAAPEAEGETEPEPETVPEVERDAEPEPKPMPEAESEVEAGLDAESEIERKPKMEPPPWRMAADLTSPEVSAFSSDQLDIPAPPVARRRKRWPFLSVGLVVVALFLLWLLLGRHEGKPRPKALGTSGPATRAETARPKSTAPATPVPDQKLPKRKATAVEPAQKPKIGDSPSLAAPASVGRSSTPSPPESRAPIAEKPAPTPVTGPLVRKSVGSSHGGDKTTARVYRVVPGDTLWGIAERFTGNPWNYSEIARRNGLPNPDMIFPHQALRLKSRKSAK